MSFAVTVVIPNFNGAVLLRRNLPTVTKYLSKNDISTEILVVDDGSSDDSVRIIRQEFPYVKLVVHDVNQGFSEAIASGVKASNTELVFLLNSDVELTMDCLAVMVRYFEADDCFSVSPLIRDEDGTINRHSWNRRVFRKGNLKAIPWELSEALSLSERSDIHTAYASGGSMLVRKSMFLALGGFHPIFKPFYGEDYDIGLRAWAMGWKSYFEPGAEVVHQSRGSIKDNVRRAYVKQIRRRNRYILEWIHFPVCRLIMLTLPISIWRLVGELVILDLVNLNGFRDAVMRLPDVWRARRCLAKNRKLGFDEMMKEINR